MTGSAGQARLSEKLSDAHIFLICGVIALVVFVVDVAGLPLGVAAGVAYVPAVLVALRLPHWQQTFLVAGAVSILTVVGFLLGKPAPVLWMVLANRLLALSAIWLTAIGGNWLILTKRKAAEEKLEQAEQETDSARAMPKSGFLKQPAMTSGITCRRWCCSMLPWARRRTRRRLRRCWECRATRLVTSAT